ncbi:heat-inducible transcriptional repressor HrcA [Novosphingobium sp.]|jgi:heat-inducible transcriptional repressor|uniref:heat-inducible transcriptional repressor HrcA n=1 Tax=Novosphingobium sp. TaxID=1874826 RepID=UPI0022C8134D|nr:heat-inducible transcriptional repressor HrcA [Novosphingobium sp.]MCZ8017313.1 heat-inducible transcriptional repressor HrcA [Novosphingobium sp.]MCZ8034164.1 heat-inducible transcriptional repressor HrcA [Novosphingobium sp.]MCZ8051519.1 heat-inducible transcriptional repressor HrcA [Novosphingobium sp.]MCZ8059865.1 heat-inducible transcriptional repressor HrcA [Novosphingobium sp.]MCZ8231703.1 heat-inducible transcriptional repressor HrcA [Novosphingobium sp.]
MSTPPITELTTRARDIFRLVVEGYLATGQAVGSKTLASAGALNLSPASIRSVLHELESLGLLAAPHTSAGRLPTESGLRLFVDGMMQVAEPTAEERAAIESRLAQPGPVEAALEATSALLSSLSSAAGVVMVPRREPRLAHLQLVPLATDRALAVLVGADGSVENRVVDLPPGLPPRALEQASNYISAHLGGRTLPEAVRAIRMEVASGRSALDAASRDLVERGLAVWSEDALRRPVLIVRGQANLLDEGALGDIERVRQLLDDLENKQSVAELLDAAREAEATRIFIGAENRLFALSGSSVIASPYRDRDGRVVGVVGVIGPTRLNYARLVPMVDFTAQTLSRMGAMGKLIG